MLFDNHEDDRTIIHFAHGMSKLDGFYQGMEDNCAKFSSSPGGKGTTKYLPWPNSNIAFIEFLSPAKQE